MAGTLVDGRYELRYLVGSGGMADVYLAHDEVLDRDVALKLLKAKYAEDEEFVERFRREARSAAALANPYTVPIFDRGRDRGWHLLHSDGVSARWNPQGTDEEQGEALAPDGSRGGAP